MSTRTGRGGGFSVVELMVSVVIGMLAIMFATRLITNAERNKQSALGGSDSMQNGMLAMFSISGDAAQAGFGLNDTLVDGCNTVFNDNGGYALAPAARDAAIVHPLAAAVIESGGTGPDRLTLYSGTAIGGTATLRVTSDYIGGTSINVDRVPYGFSAGDVIVVAPETVGADCALAQVSAVGNQPLPGQQFIMVASGGAYRFNTGALGASYTGGVARLFNLGPATSLPFHTWSVTDGFLQLRSTDLSGAGAPPASVADNIVSIKAEYGFDIRAGAAFQPQDGLVLGQWSATMVDADGDGVSGGAGDYQRVAALRIAVVARSKDPERGDPVTGACSATTTAPVVFGAAEPADVDPAPITLNVAVAGDPVDWRCYRYRVFETIVPLRNAGWRPSA